MNIKKENPSTWLTSMRQMKHIASNETQMKHIAFNFTAIQQHIHDTENSNSFIKPNYNVENKLL